VAFALLLGSLACADARGQDAGEVKVTGTLVVEDETGAEVADESGSAVVEIHERSNDGWSGRPTKVFVIDGNFELSLKPGQQVSFEAFALDDGKAYWLPGGAFPEEHGHHFSEGIAIPPDRKLEIRARYAPPCVLKVTDSDTGRELTDVDVVLDVYHDQDRSTMGNAHWLGSRQLHPTPGWSTDLRARKAASPIPLEVNLEETFLQWSESYWVHAPGHEWGVLNVDFRRGGNLDVKLRRAGELVVSVEGVDPPKDAKLILRAAGSVHGEAGHAEAGDTEADQDDEADDADDEEDATDASGLLHDEPDALLEWWPVDRQHPARLDGIPFNHYVVELVIGERFRGHETLASTPVEVKDGEVAHATLRVDKVPTAPEPVPLAITLDVDPGWGSESFEIALLPERVSPLLKQKFVRIERDRMVADPARPGHFSIPETRVAPGSYAMSIDVFGIRRALKVAAGLAPVSIQIGPPAPMTLHFVDARTKAPLQPEFVDWFLAEKETREGGPSFFGHSIEKPVSEFKARVPAGRIGVQAEIAGYESFKPKFIEVDPQGSDVVVPLKHYTGIQVRFRIDGRDVPWSEAIHTAKGDAEHFDFYEVRLERKGGSPVDDDVGSWGSGPSGSGRYFTAPSAGDYKATFPPIDGFEPIAPRDVKIEDQQFTDVAVDLVRKKK
jgi:hypothetical protein